MRRARLAYAPLRPGEQKRKGFDGKPVNEKAPVHLSRDLEVVQIPEGYKVRLAREPRSS